MVSKRNWPGEPSGREEKPRPPYPLPTDYNVGTGYSPGHHRVSNPKPIKRKMSTGKKVILIVAALVIFFLFASCLVILSRASDSNSSGSVSVVPPVPLESPAGASAQATTESNATQFNDGDWLVGQDKEVLPGIYRSPGASERSTGGAFFCSVLIEKGDEIVGGESSDGPDKPIRITLRDGHTVTANGCKTFQRVG